MLENQSVKIGVTGHLKISDSEELFVSAQKILRIIQQHNINKDIIVYSPLAPGADSLLAQIALDIRIPLCVIIPNNETTYLQSFNPDHLKLYEQLSQQADSIIHLPAIKGLDNYQSIGIYLISNMDYLVAFWDGEEAHGPGGTAEVVNKFNATRKPWAWIFTQNLRRHLTPALANKMTQGSIKLMNWDLRK